MTPERFTGETDFKNRGLTRQVVGRGLEIRQLSLTFFEMCWFE